MGTSRVGGPMLGAFAVVFGMTVLVGCTSSGSDPTAATRIPAKLANIGWMMTSIQAAGHTAVPGTTGLVMRTNGNFQIALTSCAGLLGRATFAAHTATFASRYSNHRCPYEASRRDAQSDPTQAQLIQDILTGTVEWKADSEHLDITKRGVGTIVFAKGPVDPPSPNGEA